MPWRQDDFLRGRTHVVPASWQPLELCALSLIYPLFQVFKSKYTATKLFSYGFIRVRNQLHGSSKILKARWRRGSLLLHKIADTLFCIVQLIFAYLLYSQLISDRRVTYDLFT